MVQEAALAASIKTRIAALLRNTALPLRVSLWNGTEFDLGPAPAVRFVLRRPELMRRLLRGDVDSLADAYVHGDLAVEGRLEDILKVGIELAERLGRVRWIGAVARFLPRRSRRHSRSSDAEWVRHHYDVSNEFYALWLDRRMTYSCAYFHTGQEDIDTAQDQKLDHICRKLRLQPGDRLLDVGCGWGGLVEYAVRHYGVRAVGVTLSERQYELACRRLGEAGLADRAEIRLQDYRDIADSEPFDKIVSIGMYEHVGGANRPLYFAKLFGLLKENGLLLNHGITTADPAGASAGPAGGGFIDRYVFPGGELPHIAQVVREMAEQRFEVLDVENLRPHYAATLLHWVRRLEARKDEVIERVGAARYRIWRIYMAGCAIAFERNWLSLYQVLAGKGGGNGALRRPWTRRHQYDADDPAFFPRPLDWAGI